MTAMSERSEMTVSHEEIGTTITHLLGDDTPFILMFPGANGHAQVMSNLTPDVAMDLLRLHLRQMEAGMMSAPREIPIGEPS